MHSFLLEGIIFKYDVKAMLMQLFFLRQIEMQYLVSDVLSRFQLTATQRSKPLNFEKVPQKINKRFDSSFCITFLILLHHSLFELLKISTKTLQFT